MSERIKNAAEALEALTAGDIIKLGDCGSAVLVLIDVLRKTSPIMEYVVIGIPDPEKPINAIKAWREVTGRGLAEAKAVIDSIRTGSSYVVTASEAARLGREFGFKIKERAVA